MSFRSVARSSPDISAFFSRRSTMLAISFAIALSAVCCNADAQTVVVPPPGAYTFTDLGTLPGDVYSVGYAINESGDVAGYSVSPSGQKRAVIFKEGKVIDLGLAPGANASAAYGINGYDQVTGEVDFPVSGYFGFVSHAFLYSAGKMQDIGTLQFPDVPREVDFGFGTAINDSGQIAGAARGGPIFGSGVNPEVFLYSAGKLTDTFQTDAVPFFNPFANGIGNNVNASGQIAAGNATAINDSGQTTGSLDYRAFLQSNGTLTDIAPPPTFGPYSYGTGINASGQIVEISGDAQGNYGIPLLYTPGPGLTRLPLGFTDHLAINDKGQITGRQGDHAFLLSPVFVPFSTLDAVVDITGTSRTTFAAGGRFTLGAESDGIDPLTETTVLQLGGYHISIPPSSFVKTNGIYFYQGKIGNVAVQAVIRPLTARIFLFGIVGQGASGLPTSYPLKLVLTIGNDTRSQEIRTNYDASNLTEAEVCKDFRLPCNN